MHGMPVAPAVELLGVHKFYGDFHALRGVDLSIARGAVCVAIGPSGSGKSTLARVFTGLLLPSACDFLFNGVALPPALNSRS